MNVTISRILVPIDFSPHAERALSYATALAGRLGASLDLLHVVEDPVATGAWHGEVAVPNLTGLRQELVEQAERRIDRYQAAAEASGAPVVATVRVGLPADAITDYAKTLGIDLIVMGTHGRSGLAHLFMGSVAEHVIRQAPCPVLTLRAAEARETTERASEPTTVRAAVGHGGASRE